MIVGIKQDAKQFCSALNALSQWRSKGRKGPNGYSSATRLPTEASLSKNEREWPEWEPAFVNYLSTIPGVNAGISLCYVVREPETPDRSEPAGMRNNTLY